MRGRPQTSLPPETIDEIIRLRYSGMTIKDISEELGITIHQVSKVPFNKVTPEIENRIRELYKERYSIRKIKRETGISEYRIKKILKEEIELDRLCEAKKTNKSGFESSDSEESF